MIRICWWETRTAGFARHDMKSLYSFRLSCHEHTDQLVCLLTWPGVTDASQRPAHLSSSNVIYDTKTSTSIYAFGCTSVLEVNKLKTSMPSFVLHLVCSKKDGAASNEWWMVVNVAKYRKTSNKTNIYASLQTNIHNYSYVVVNPENASRRVSINLPRAFFVLFISDLAYWRKKKCSDCQDADWKMV